MAFVAPITPFDRIQYANRTILSMQKKRRLHNVTPMTATNFYEQEEDLLESYAKRQWPKLCTHGHLTNIEKARSIFVSEEDASCMTGKGMHINEYV